jgi:four helix bundle protein
MAKGDDIEERLVSFAVRVIRLCESLPNTRSGQHIAGQPLPSGTAPAAHYAEARGAESINDFVHKLRICLKELNESRVWLKIVLQSEMLSTPRLEQINQECDELCRIINASIRTTKERQP